MAESNKHPNIKSLFNLSKSSRRATFYAIFLLAGAGFLLAGVLWWQISNDIPSSVDKMLD